MRELSTATTWSLTPRAAAADPVESLPHAAPASPGYQTTTTTCFAALARPRSVYMAADVLTVSPAAAAAWLG